MLDTPEELSSYDPAVDEFLDRVFADYGLVISGWSVAWDSALRSALSGVASRSIMPTATTTSWLPIAYRWPCPATFRTSGVLQWAAFW
jgi:hypothetical protein